MLTVQSVKIDTGSKDTIGILAFINDQLVAVLVRLDDEIHEDKRGYWYFEALFDRLPATTMTFPNEREALDWIEHHHKHKQL